MVAKFGEKEKYADGKHFGQTHHGRTATPADLHLHAKHILKTSDAEHLKSESLKARRQEIESQLLARIAQLTGDVLR